MHALSGVETRSTHAFVSAGTQVPPQPMEVRSSGLSCLEQGIYPRRNCDTVGHGNPTYELLVGRDSNPAVDVVDFDIGYGIRPPHAIVSAGTQVPLQPMEDRSSGL